MFVPQRLPAVTVVVVESDTCATLRGRLECRCKEPSCPKRTIFVDAFVQPHSITGRCRAIVSPYF